MFWTPTGNVAVWRRFRRDALEVAICHGWKPQPRWRQPHLAGGEVLVSRGELVEIGGSFRMPDIIGPSGARLVEVGTTNETRRADYARAITSHARLLLKVHPSNYRIEGFTAAVTTADLAALGRDRDIQVVEDLGSGALVDLQRFGLPFEPTVTEPLRPARISSPAAATSCWAGRRPG